MISTAGFTLASCAALVSLLAVSSLLVTSVRNHRPVPVGLSSVVPHVGEPGPARLLALVGVVAVPVGAIAWFTSTSGFTWDDIKNLRQAQVEPLSIDYLLKSTSGHFAPGHRLGDWVLERLFPFNFPASQVLLLIGFALTLLLFHRILVELTRPGPGPLVLTLLYGTSVVHVHVIQWWASGLDRVPATGFSFLAILAYLRFFRTGRRWWVVVSLGSLAVGLLFYVKPALVPLYLVLLRLLVLERDRPLRETLTEAVRDWWVWTAYAVVVGVFLIVYVRQYPLDRAPSMATLAQYLATLWTRVVAPNLVGLYVPWHSSSPWSIVGVVVAEVALATLVVWSVRRSRSAWRPWAFFAATAVVNAALVGRTRVGYFSGTKIAYTLYFNLEIFFLFFMALAAALLPTRDSPRPPQSAPPSPAPATGSPNAGAGRALVALAVSLSVAFSWIGAHHISSREVWVGRQARVYVENAEDGLRRARSSGGGVALVDGVVPWYVAPYLLVPYNSFSEVFPLLDPEVAFDQAGRRLFTVGLDGKVHPVSFVAEGGGDVRRASQSGSLVLAGSATRDDRQGRCLTAGGTPAVASLTPPKPVRGDVSLALRYSARRPVVVSMVVEPKQRGPDGRDKFRLVNLAPGDHDTVFALDAPTADRVHVVLSPHSELCLRRLEVGGLAPRP